MKFNRDQIKKLDTRDVLGSIKQLPDQIEQVVSDISKLDFPARYRNLNKIALSGMGGSIYAAHVIPSLFPDQLKVPLIVINDYQVPSTVDKRTLFIGASYSGTTEEVAMTTQAALKKTKAVTAVTSGGDLARLMEQHNLPYYHFEPKFNPSGQPRVGLGYMVFGPVMMLYKLGYLNTDVNKLKNSLKKMRDYDQEMQSRSQRLIAKIKDRAVITITAEHLRGSAHIVRNQFNETAKTYADYHLIPELNHHLIEGLTYPKSKTSIFLLYSSPYFYSRNKQRLAITERVLKKQSFSTIDVSFKSANKLEEFLFFLQFNSYLTFFLSIEYNLDPAAIPWVDYFKKQLRN